LKDELGDLLLQVVFHAQMAAEQDAFTYADVEAAIVEKLIRRHPHVFGDTVFTSEAEVKQSWETIKAAERTARLADREARAAKALAASDMNPHSPAAVGSDNAPVPSALDGIARALPALKRADKLQKRAARVGFDWPEVRQVIAKLDEELAEVAEAANNQDTDALEDEIGDVLFAAVNLARHYGMDAETALARANRKFDQRFRLVEELAKQTHNSLDALSLDDMERLWSKAKAQLKT